MVKRAAHDAPGEGDSAPDVLARYLDRLADGMDLDDGAILRDHPDSGQEIVAQLEIFRVAGARLRGQSESLPRSLGDYTLLRVLGRGGMGLVYEAWQSALERRVALKVLPVGVGGDEKTFQRFMREARTTGQLSHPNVVPVHAMGVTEGTPYYAMELVEGETLARLLGGVRRTGEGDVITPEDSSKLEDSLVSVLASAVRLADARDAPVPPAGEKVYRRLAEALAGAAEGLQHAHECGVIHRDIKPSNLIFDREGRLRVLDFGLARLEGEEGLTLTGELIGTPGFMSPEQARPGRWPLDARTDVYSLGATLYELLTLAPPFRGKDYQDTLGQIADREALAPRQRNVRIPRELETIVLTCLRKDPRDRYGTAAALADDLRRCARGEPILARPESRWEVAARRLWRRRRLVIAGAAVVAVAFLGLLFATGWIAHERNLARESFYLASMRIVDDAWKAGNRRGAREILDRHRPGAAGTESPGWEWFHFDALLRDTSSALVGHSGAVGSVDWSPRGERIASAGDDGTVRVWSVEHRKQLAERKLSTQGLRVVRWRPVPGDGSFLAAGGREGVVTLWELSRDGDLLRDGDLPQDGEFSQAGDLLRDGEPVRFEAHPRDADHWGGVLALEWSPDGSRLATCATEGVARIWNPERGELLHELAVEETTKTRPLFALAWRPDGLALAAATGFRSEVVIWDAVEGDRVVRLAPGRPGDLHALAWSPDGRRLAAGGGDQEISVWDLADGKRRRVVAGHDATVRALAFRPDGDRLSSAGADGVVKIWDLTGSAVNVLRAHAGAATVVAWRPDGAALASAGHDGRVRIWDPEERQRGRRLEGCNGLAVWHPYEPWLATKGRSTDGEDNVIKCLDATTGDVVSELLVDVDSAKDWLFSLAWSEDGEKIAAVTSDGKLRVLAPASRRELFEVEVHEGFPFSVAWAPDGRRIATGGADRAVRIWDAVDGRLLKELSGHEELVVTVRWSPDGRRLATLSRDQEVRVWEGATWTELLRRRPDAPPVHVGRGDALAWSPLSDRLAVGTSAGELIVWGVPHGEVVLRRRGHSAYVRAMAWSPDGRRLASGSDDRTVRVWDAAHGDELLVLKAHASRVMGVAWSADGRRLAAASAGDVGEVWVWTAPGFASGEAAER